MRKRIFALILSVCLCLACSTTVFASGIVNPTSGLSSEEEYMSLVILRNSGVQITPTSSYTLLDVSGNPTIVCVEFTHGGVYSGFGLIDLTTYTVTMYALDAVAPFEATDIVISDGILNFAIVNEDLITARDVYTNDILAVGDIIINSQVSMSVISQQERDNIIRGMKNTDDTMQTRNVETILVAGGNDVSLVYSAGNNDGNYETDCGINAVAMYLRHMDNYFDSSYVASYHPTETNLKCALAALADTEWMITTSLSMNRLATLTNIYLEIHGGNSTANVANTPYNFANYKARINNGNGKPCILYIGAKKTSYWGNAHAVVGVGYTGGATASSGYLVVNSGWTSLKYVQIATSIPGYIIK